MNHLELDDLKPEPDAIFEDYPDTLFGIGPKDPGPDQPAPKPEKPESPDPPRAPVPGRPEDL